ncbi:hypothetical protein [Mangrovicella endophytica]|uniref:hypothetical protein n=1 Tax=Mangrovicella endophytica TaxID=2066697 RepID=UPI000C9E3D67|nr:hypothetical protein [Mangrovicella endophytica]
MSGVAGITGVARSWAASPNLISKGTAAGGGTAVLGPPTVPSAAAAPVAGVAASLGALSERTPRSALSTNDVLHAYARSAASGSATMPSFSAGSARHAEAGDHGHDAGHPSVDHAAGGLLSAEEPGAAAAPVLLPYSAFFDGGGAFDQEITDVPQSLNVLAPALAASTYVELPTLGAAEPVGEPNTLSPLDDPFGSIGMGQWGLETHDTAAMDDAPDGIDGTAVPAAAFAAAPPVFQTRGPAESSFVDEAATIAIPTAASVLAGTNGPASTLGRVIDPYLHVEPERPRMITTIVPDIPVYAGVHAGSTFEQSHERTDHLIAEPLTELPVQSLEFRRSFQVNDEEIVNEILHRIREFEEDRINRTADNDVQPRMRIDITLGRDPNDRIFAPYERTAAYAMAFYRDNGASAGPVM